MSTSPLPSPPALDPAPARATVHSPQPSRRPTWRLLLSHPAHMLSLGFGSGLPRQAPGTFGTLASWLLFVWLDQWLGTGAWFALIGASFLLGAWAAQVTGRRLGGDSGHIVIDEIVAFWLVLLLLPADAGPITQAIAFLLFRLFDIAKPPPIGLLDARIDNGLGVMLDDLVAAFYTLLVLAIALRVAG
ncbi:MAG: phosphatidylglycerophosphatase A [Betaproteobacteria bacterium]